MAIERRLTFSGRWYCEALYHSPDTSWLTATRAFH